ncbi:MAG: DinB family protein [Planctomycetaceae bacterium]
MIEETKKSIASQYIAAFLTLQKCIDQCPTKTWATRVANNDYSQSLFHALFFGDLYLGNNIDAMKSQAFHLEHSDEFDDYEELSHSKPVNKYSREFVQAYLDFCTAKSQAIVGAETADSLVAQVDSPWHTFSRLEMHVYNIRHLQHHAAQLILRLRLEHDPEIGWDRNGYDHLTPDDEAD